MLNVIGCFVHLFDVKYIFQGLGEESVLSLGF